MRGIYTDKFNKLDEISFMFCYLIINQINSTE